MLFERSNFKARKGCVESADSAKRFQEALDTSPYTNWVRYQSLSKRTRTEHGPTISDAIPEYDRLLASARFFAPAIQGAAYLVLDVLARDVKSRPEDGDDDTI